MLVFTYVVVVVASFTCFDLWSCMPIRIFVGNRKFYGFPSNFNLNTSFFFLDPREVLKESHMEAKAADILAGKLPYDLRVYTSVLRTYQLNPAEYKENTVARILVHSLAKFPTNDFGVCLCLISERRQEELKHILALDDLVQKGQFPAFWQAIRSDERVSKLVASIPEFEGAIRKTILDRYVKSFQKVSVADLNDALGCKDGAALAQKAGAKVEGDVISFPQSEFNTPKVQDAPEGLSTNDIQKIMRL
jgi:hypothetical protein